MSKHSTTKQSGLQPKLRFPEFRDKGDWDVKPLGKIAEVLQGFGFPEKHQGKTEGKYPFYKVSDISNSLQKGEHLIKESANYIYDDTLKTLKAKLIPVGSTVFAKIGEAIRSNRRAVTSVPCLIDNNVAALKGKKGETIDSFVYYTFSLISLEDYSGGAVPSVNKSTIENILIPCPNIPEQQKIADCLSSLDELIEAEDAKLKALQQHKKGLMQELFPAEGETFPKLRFPEFRDAEVWNNTVLGDTLISITNGLSVSQTVETRGYKVTRIETISDRTINLNKVGYINTEQDISEYKLKIGDILFSNINSIAHIGKTVIIDRDYDLHHGMNLLRLQVDKRQNDPRFIFYLLNSEEIRASFRERANKAVNQASINQTALSRVPISNTILAEQQKIADCLSSLDELIEVESGKLDALKHHKKGLMQQLFPTFNEVQE
jgi:type I restriction enzyme S subunit